VAHAIRTRPTPYAIALSADEQRYLAVSGQNRQELRLPTTWGYRTCCFVF